MLFVTVLPGMLSHYLGRKTKCSQNPFPAMYTQVKKQLHTGIHLFPKVHVENERISHKKETGMSKDCAKYLITFKTRALLYPRVVGWLSTGTEKIFYCVAFSFLLQYSLFHMNDTILNYVKY